MVVVGIPDLLKSRTVPFSFSVTAKTESTGNSPQSRGGSTGTDIYINEI